MLTHEIPPDFRSGVHLFIYTAIRHRVMQVRTDGGHCRESAGTGPVVLKVVRGTGTGPVVLKVVRGMGATFFADITTDN